MHDILWYSEMDFYCNKIQGQNGNSGVIYAYLEIIAYSYSIVSLYKVH